MREVQEGSGAENGTGGCADRDRTLKTSTVSCRNGEPTAKKIGRNSKEGCLGQVRQGHIYRAIQENHIAYGKSIDEACRLLRVSRSAYYKWASGKLSSSAVENAVLTAATSARGKQRARST